jgi:hypothetical protein
MLTSEQFERCKRLGLRGNLRVYSSFLVRSVPTLNRSKSHFNFFFRSIPTLWKNFPVMLRLEARHSRKR